jgi:hypothetical protein
MKVPDRTLKLVVVASFTTSADAALLSNEIISNL